MLGHSNIYHSILYWNCTLLLPRRWNHLCALDMQVRKVPSPETPVLKTQVSAMLGYTTSAYEACSSLWRAFLYINYTLYIGVNSVLVTALHKLHTVGVNSVLVQVPADHYYLAW